MGEKVPAVNHKDGTARLQTVTAESNPWYHGFISKWEQISGVPILLNTSFNDREPIVETPENAIACFDKTHIDYLYFRDFGILISKIT
jgi:carbamoyltransferase